MTITARTPAIKRVPMDSLRKTALVAGMLYLLTFVSIPTLALYGPVQRSELHRRPRPGHAVFVGGVLEMIVALAGIGTAVALYPVVKRQNEGVALGFVGSRVLEAATIFAGVVVPPVDRDLAAGRSRSRCVGHRPGAGRPIRLVVPPRTKPHAGRERPVAGLPAVPVAPGAASPSPARIRRSAPARSLPTSPCCSASSGQVSALSALAALPIALWEFSLGVYLVVRGFKPSPITAGMPLPAPRPPTAQSAGMTVDETAGPTKGPAAARAGRPRRLRPGRLPADHQARRHPGPSIESDPRRTSASTGTSLDPGRTISARSRRTTDPFELPPSSSPTPAKNARIRACACASPTPWSPAHPARQPIIRGRVCHFSTERARGSVRSRIRRNVHSVLPADDAMSANKSDAPTAYERTRQVHDTDACRRDDQITSAGRYVRFCRSAAARISRRRGTGRRGGRPGRAAPARSPAAGRSASVAPRATASATAESRSPTWKSKCIIGRCCPSTGGQTGGW